MYQTVPPRPPSLTRTGQAAYCYRSAGSKTHHHMYYRTRSRSWLISGRRARPFLLLWSMASSKSWTVSLSSLPLPPDQTLLLPQRPCGLAVHITTHHSVLSNCCLPFCRRHDNSSWQSSFQPPGTSPCHSAKSNACYSSQPCSDPRQPQQNNPAELNQPTSSWVGTSPGLCSGACFCFCAYALQLRNPQ